MTDVNLGQSAASTLRNRNSEVADSVTDNNALLAWLKNKNRIETREGGRTYVEPIAFAENDTAKFYDGALESFSINTQSTLDASEWARKFQAGFIYFTEQEKQSNRGEAAAVKIVKHKINVLKATLANQFSVSCYDDGSTSNEVVGLQALVADDPTAVATVGGIAQGTYAWWRNKTNTSTTASASNIQSTMTSVWLSTIRGTDKPDLIVAGTDMFTYYASSLTALQRFTSANDTGDILGFENLKFQSATVLFDPTCATKRMYFLNTNDFTLVCDPGARWEVGEARDVANAFYDVTPVKWSGALIVSRRESHAVIEGTAA